jgi:hypothetical protein
MSDLPPMPKCWTSADDWHWWNRYNVLARDNPRRPLDNFCADCVPAFKQEQVRLGHCAHPTVTFVSIIERQYDPRLMARKDVKTRAVRGVRDDET